MPWTNYLDAAMYHHLRLRAAALVEREFVCLSVQGDDLLNEAFLRLIRYGGGVLCTGPDHFRAMMGMRMRHVLVDLVRATRASKRGHNYKRVPLEDCVAGFPDGVSHYLIVGQAFDRLGEKEARQQRVLELRINGTTSLREIAAELSVSVRTVRRDLAKASEWMCAELNLQARTSRTKRTGTSLLRKIAA